MDGAESCITGIRVNVRTENNTMKYRYQYRNILRLLGSTGKIRTMVQ